jgi:glycerol-3-phosphate O-acyltransferase
MDDIGQAVLARGEIIDYLRSGEHAANPGARARVEEYLDELRTTQRYRFYRALQHPLYPILRKVTKITEHIERAGDATSHGQVVYISNHKSHIDYLIEPLVMDDHGIRPPLIAAGINLFSGPIGMLNRHVTGAVPIRRNSKDPLYLVTLRAYVAELLKRRDLLYYSEGGRSYSGELKSPKTGLLQAALAAGREEISVLPMAVAYDLVLEDRMLARQATKREHRPFAQELAEMVRHAVGFKTRAFITFGTPIPLAEYQPDSRRDLVTLTHRIQDQIALLYKVLPTALVAATIKPGMTRGELAGRIDDRLAVLAPAGANLAVTSGRQAVDEGVEALIERHILVAERARLRVRDRITLKYYARTIEHLMRTGGKASH